MVFTDLNDLLNIGGHGYYVWLAYGATVAALIALAVLPLLAQRRQLREVARQARRDTLAGITPDDSPEAHEED